jgi:hypothetical protein
VNCDAFGKNFDLSALLRADTVIASAFTDQDGGWTLRVPLNGHVLFCAVEVDKFAGFHTGILALLTDMSRFIR